MDNPISFFRNSVETDIYVGRSAGKMLKRDIEFSQKSVKVISPFLSPDYINMLIQQKKHGIDVRLITSDEIEDYKNFRKNERIITQLIQQERHVDTKAKKVRDKMIKANKVILALWIAGFVLSFYSFDNNFPETIWIFGAAIILLITFGIMQTNIRTKTIYSYSYHELFPFRVFTSPWNRKFRGQSNFYIHSKIYIIDNSIAYLGSLNFSKSGLDYNLESRVRTTDRNVIAGLNKLFDDLFECEDNYAFSTHSWGKKLYREPKN